MESDDFYNNNKFNVTSLDECKEMKEEFKHIFKKNTSQYMEDDIIDNKNLIQLNKTMRNEDILQKNIFDHDISVNYVRNRHKNMHHKKPNNLHTPNIKNEEIRMDDFENFDISSNNKSNNINFKVKIVKLMNRKVEKIIEIISLKEGLFQIYATDNPQKKLASNFSNIFKIDGDYNNNLLILTAIFNGNNKKNVWIEFFNPFEKFIFKTIYFNRMLNQIPRNLEGINLKLNVNIMTWNVGGITFPDDLGILFNSTVLEDVDIYSIGVQECSYFKSNDWQKHLQTLMNYYGFIPVTSVDMCQMFLIVFIKSKFSYFVENVKSSYKAMGFAKIVGNKGGIGISFKLFGYTMTFINCHLAPKPYKVLERNKHAKNIVKYLNIGQNSADFDISSDYLFWQGDLNYRVDYNFDEVIQELEKDNIKLLLLKDQLIKQRQLNQVFYNFQEAEINFYPTYRRIKGTDEYSNKNNQSPSWCDRIMVKSERDVHFLYYDSIKSVKHSDHLPVLGRFSISLTSPFISDLDKIMSKIITGKFCYKNIKMTFDFSEAKDELDINFKFPARLKIQGFSFLNKNPYETNQLIIENLSNFENQLIFENLNINFPPQLLYDVQYSKAFSIIFVLILSIGKYNYEIGFAKYCLEKLEKDNINIMNHSFKSDIYLRTRKLGEISFDCEYKCER